MAVEFTEKELDFILTQLCDGYDGDNVFEGGKDNIGLAIRDGIVDKIANNLYPQVKERPVPSGDPRINWYWY